MREEDYKAIIEKLIELIDDGVYIVSRDGMGIFYNHAMANIEEIKVSDVIGRQFHEAFPGVALSESTMFNALTKGVTTQNRQQSYVNLYGKEVATTNTTVPVKRDGNIIAAIEVAKDVTNIRELSDKIAQLEAGYGGKNKTKPSNNKQRLVKHYNFNDIVGQNSEFIKMINIAQKAAQNNTSVFIYGETGTGKELFAQSIHYGGVRAKKPFMAQNCAALPEALLEGILFGTAKGGFTGAVDRIGLFEQADGGTLLLDEISAMPYDLQSKLLRVLQEDYIRRVGGTKEIPVDVRIIATVNEPPDKLIAEGKLRKDLYYRLNVVNLIIPPLRKRKDDIPLLADKFLEKHCKRFDKEIWLITDDVIKSLKNYNYPGNVRELENIIMQSVAMADKEHALTTKLLKMPVGIKHVASVVSQWDGHSPLDVYLADIEKELIRKTMIEEGGVIARAADRLHIKRQTLQHKLKKYGMRPI